MARTLLVLWDIDHTLTENHGVNKEIYAHAFELLTGHGAEYEAQTDGRTEPEIMDRGLRGFHEGVRVLPEVPRPGRDDRHGAVSGRHPAAHANDRRCPAGQAPERRVGMMRATKELLSGPPEKVSALLE